MDKQVSYQGNQKCHFNEEKAQTQNLSEITSVLQPAQKAALVFILDNPNTFCVLLFN